MKILHYRNFTTISIILITFGMLVSLSLIATPTTKVLDTNRPSFILNQLESSQPDVNNILTKVNPNPAQLLSQTSLQKVTSLTDLPTHSPIAIDGNANFTATVGANGWTGSGVDGRSYYN